MKKIRGLSLLQKLMLMLSVLLCILFLSFMISTLNIYYAETQIQYNEYEYKVEAYTDSVNNSLNSITTHMREILQDLADPQSVSKLRSQNESEKKLELSSYYEKLANKCENVENLDIIFLIDTSNDQKIWTYSKEVPLSVKQDFWYYVDGKNYAYKGWNEKKWQIYWMDGEPYYLKMYIMNGFILGAFSSESYYSAEIRAIEGDDQYRWALVAEDHIESNFIEKEEDLIRYQGKKNGYKWIVVKRDFPILDAELYMVFSNNYWAMFRNILITSVMVLLMLCVVIDVFIIRCLQVFVVRPVDKLVEASEQIIHGKYDYTIPETGRGEILVLEKAFNSALHTVVDLKIDQYEQKLVQQRKELKALRQQLKPHFYLNALSVVKGMAYQKETEKILQYIDLLTIHIRYMLKNNAPDTSIGEEISQVKNYVNLQKICFPNKITAFIQCEENCEDVRIPYLLIQTLVENAFKHARSTDNFVMFNLSVYREESMTVIEYEDSGEGFSEEDLKRYAKVNPDCEEHLGLNNIRKTLEIRYGRKDLMTLSNGTPHGAKIKICIPDQEKER